MDYDSLKLKTIYSEILQGYTFYDSPFFGAIYFKHFTPSDFSSIDVYAEKFFNKAVNNGILTREEKIKQLKEDDFWPSDDERSLNELKAITANQLRKKSNESIPSVIEMLTNAIADNKKEIKRLEGKIDEIVGQTAEGYSISKINEMFAFNAAYKTKTLDVKKFTEEEFDDLEPEQLTELIVSYNKKVSRINTEIIRKLALEDSFMSHFSICKNNPFTFYGKSVCELTSYQTELFIYGANFRSILTRYGDEIPEDVAKDPDLLIEWNDARTIAEKGPKGVNTNGNFTVPGAKASDYEKWGFNDSNSVNLSKEARKQGKNFSMQDIMRLQGH